MQAGTEMTRRGLVQPMLEAARAISAVSTQIDLALRESQQPVERLGTSVSRIGMTLATLGASVEAQPGSELDLAVDLQVDWAVAQLQQEFAKAIENLQFHDRMVQHLSHLHDYLMGVSSLLASIVEESCEGTVADREDAADPAWRELRERLFQRLISDSQRQFLQLMLPSAVDEPAHASDDVRSQHSDQGSIELF